MNHQFYTYLHCKPNGDPFYVGKGHGKRSHNLFISSRNKFHKNIVAKYGAEHIGVFVFPCDSETEAFSDEIRLIAQLRTEGWELANRTEGGEGPRGRILSPEHRRNMSVAAMGRKMSPETKAKLSATNRGRKLSAETRAKMSAAATGKAVSPETRAKLSIANIGKKHPPRLCSLETRAKMAASAKGNKSATGHKLSMEAKTKISRSLKAMWRARKGD